MSPEQGRPFISQRGERLVFGWSNAFFKRLLGSSRTVLPWCRGWLSQSETKVIEPRVLEPDVPRDLNDLCRGLLDKIPKNRPCANDVLRAVVGPQGKRSQP